MKYNTTIFIFLIVIVIGCGKNKNPCGLSEKTLLDLNRFDSAAQVAQNRDFYAKIMQNEYGEPSLLAAGLETYRFIRHSSFGPWKVVRIEKRENNYTAIIKEFGQDTSYSDRTRRDKEFSLSKDKWQHILDELNAQNFWTYPTIDTIDEGYMLDGETWSLEGYKLKKDPCTFKNYHYISRLSPSDTTFVNMCLLLYDLKPN